MTHSVTLVVVLAAVYGLVHSLLSVLLAAAWSLGIKRMPASANELLALRLFPAGGAILLVFTVVLPAFLVAEPSREYEAGGPLLAALAMIGLFGIGLGIGRALRASRAAGAFLKRCNPVAHRSVVAGRRVEVVDVPDPIVAVVGGLRPRIIASKRVLSACSDEEFLQVVAHESAHVSARDNLKLFLLVLSPDVLAWLPAGAALAARWRAAVEREADEHATGADPWKRLALASALIKVARLSTSVSPPRPALSLPMAGDDVEVRVRALLAPSLPARRSKRLWALAVSALLFPVIGVPLYGLVHHFIEALVAFGL